MLLPLVRTWPVIDRITKPHLFAGHFSLSDAKPAVAYGTPLVIEIYFYSSP